MNTLERNILDTFKALLLKHLSLYKMILFGSRARGDATRYSDIDVLVILDKSSGGQDYEYVSDCAWAVDFEHGIVVVPGCLYAGGMGE